MFSTGRGSKCVARTGFRILTASSTGQLIDSRGLIEFFTERAEKNFWRAVENCGIPASSLLFRIAAHSRKMT